MKIKKVDIQAFRLFDNVTVDLTATKNSNKAANLVAIYAPNGFGKTSFFDAMEFCITKSIHRVRSNFKENFTVDQKQGVTTFIHNKELPQRPIKISMSFEDMEDIKTTCFPEEECSLLLSESNIEHKYFRDAILSQDWLSDFLSTKNAVDRFKIFMENFEETNRLLDYYRSLSKASRSIGIELNKKKSELKKLQGRIDKSLSIDILKTINTESDKMHLLGLDIDLKKDDEQSFMAEKIKCETTIGNLSIEYENTNQLELMLDKCKTELEKVSKRLKEIKTYKELNSKIAQYQLKINDLKKQIESYMFLINGYNNYCKLQNERITVLNDKKNLILQQKKKLSEINELNLSLERLVNDIVRLNEQKKINETALLNLHEQYKKINELQDLLTHISDKLFNDEKKLENRRKEFKVKVEELDKLANLRNELSKNRAYFIVGVFEDDTKQLIELSEILNNKKTELEEIKRHISDKIEFEDVLQKLLSSSQNVMKHLEGGICPLCGFDYKDYKELLIHVNNNSILNASIKKDEEIKQKIESEIIYIEQKHVISSLIKKIDERFETINNEKEEILNVIKLQEASLNKLKKDKLDNEEYLNKNFSALLNVSESEKRQFYKELVYKYAISLEQLNTENKDKKNRKYNLEKEIEVISRDILSLSEKLLKIEEDEFYHNYSVSISDRELTNEALDIWNAELQKVSLEKKELTEIIIKANKELDAFAEKKVNSIEELICNQTYDSLTSQYNAMNDRYFKTIHFLVTKCNIRELEKEVNINSIIDAYNKVSYNIRNSKKEIEYKIRCIQEFLKLLEVGERYIKNEKSKKEYDVLLKNLENVQTNKGIVDTEKNRLQKYLEDFVYGFFQLDIINKLYNTIDPHPEYKKIDFECDFTYKDPRLNVLMYSENQKKESIVPNLYFSTAQINILAFCIFMAKALFIKTDTGKNLDCIFIDDPIQALDDINILSMIDLLRNIAFTLDKQIILTTHDKDFFELLKMKVPDRLFNSRFIEFKERGVLE